tara:strand:- start:12504 stop:15677 length:3174 start_codon:yes stop_codon:yes gene_type:complete
MTSRTVIGTDTAVANPNIGTQTFMGGTVVDFSCNSSWDSQGATLTVNLIEDSSEGQRIDKDAVVGQPRYFEIFDGSNNLVFSFYGILKSINRSVSANGERRYSATLQSPSILLEAASIITDHYAGPGDATEAVAPNTATSLEFGHINSSINPANIYNLLNPFGVFENDDFGLSTPKGFGAAQVNDEGIRIDRFVAAIDALINGSSVANPQLGRPIQYGASAWGGSVSPYYYTFDIYGFVNSISSYIPNDYRVKSTTLMDFVAELCDEINFVYMVDLKKPSGKGNAAIVGPFGSANPYSSASEGVGIFGGEIFIITQNRNVYGATKFPLSYQIIRREVSDKAGAGGASTSFSTAFTVGFGGNDLPLDFSWAGADSHPDGPPNATSPFGGEYPYEDIDQDNLERYTSTSLDVSLNESAVGGKVVVGGFQSRIGFVPYGAVDNENVYQYWGEIKRLNEFGSNASATDTASRSVPVVTKHLAGNDLRDLIMLDCQDLLGNTNVAHAFRKGIYVASMLEVRYAMTSYEAWMFFMTTTKPQKLDGIFAAFNQTYNEIKARIFNGDGSLTYAGKAYTAGALTTLASFNTSSFNISSDYIDCSAGINATASMLNIEHEMFLQKLHAKIKAMGDEHYGRSWLVKQPAFTTKLDQNEESVIGDFVKSWELSDDAYLEPVNFSAYEAPQSPYFVSNGRIKAYVNYDAHFSNSLVHGGNTVNYNFKEYFGEKFGQTQIGSDYIFHFFTDVKKEYIFLPTNYFTNYDEGLVSSIVNSAGKVTNLANMVGIDSSTTEDMVDYLMGAGDPFWVKTNYDSLGNAVSTTNMYSISDQGISMAPYALCKTKFVGEPLLTGSVSSSIDPNYENYSIDNLLSAAQMSCSANKARQANVGGSSSFSTKPHPISVAPRSFGIPQQSNRFVYGPWITNSIKLDYATRVEYEQDDNLVPENYIIPSTVTIGGTATTLTSGLGGLNTVGQAKANTIDNFDYLFTEQGSVTQPGLPAVTNLAVSLLSNGPLVSDISVNISATDITTNYSMKTFAPKLGRTNKRIIDQLGKLGKRINSIANLVK